ncbi:uncharacterized protein LOC6726002 [Drosophila simulans]|uniref:uncharacterized protein LOC6726002 n=1 Tax=Drosophila simulans TaxID=7240 RepID=UPI00078ADD3C|nr:uncharacterized protein LOC6726002 [Drosophila simulans]KMZ09829.1 uncharacterized protein Dsimw501_GD15813 [Drosophila simulans]
MNVTLVGLTTERKMKKSQKKPAMVAVPKMSLKPQRTAGLFQPKVENKTTSSTPLAAPKKVRLKDTKVADPLAKKVQSEFVTIPKNQIRKTRRNRPGDRLLDRRSRSKRTGVKAVEKRNGAGAHNWGSLLQQEIDLRQRANLSTCQGMKLPKVSSFAYDDDSSEEIEQYTLDEWRAMQAQKKQVLNKFVMSDFGTKKYATGDSGETVGAEGPVDTDDTKGSHETGGNEQTGDAETGQRSEGSRETENAEASGVPDASGGTGGSEGLGGSGELEDDCPLYLVDILLKFNTDQGVIPYHLKLI